jgi:hypothetical protein
MFRPLIGPSLCRGYKHIKQKTWCSRGCFYNTLLPFTRASQKLSTM